MTADPSAMPRLLVEATENPIALDTRAPRFSWSIPLEGRGRRQGAYRLLVATTEDLLREGEADLWDSGKVPGGRSTHVPYAGTPLTSDEIRLEIDSEMKAK